MKKGRVRIFRDKEKLKEMLSLRKQGWSSNRLAEKYNTDHTTILYQCRLYGVYPEHVIRVYREKQKMAIPVAVQRPIIKRHKYDHIINETLCQGKMYKQYLKTTA